METDKALTYTCIFPRQNASMQVFTFSAKVEDITKFAKIDRASRSDGGQLAGFQRPQISTHIREITDYLDSPGSILPNPIVVAFLTGVDIKTSGHGTGFVTIDVSQGPNGYIVDGQQRFIALSNLNRNKEFEVIVSCFICDSVNELQKQFILINNTRPLPKALIYELLPQVNGLPTRMSSRSTAAALTEWLNYREDSSLKGMIYQQTNPYGIIRDTAIQKVIMNSLSDGALRIISSKFDFKERSFRLLSDFFKAVQNVFHEDWVGHTPKTSRLVHGAGIVSMGYAMETLHSIFQASTTGEFEKGLGYLKGKTAWTEGVWNFGPNDQRQWKSIQNVPRDIMQLAQYLITTIKNYG